MGVYFTTACAGHVLLALACYVYVCNHFNLSLEGINIGHLTLKECNIVYLVCHPRMCYESISVLFQMVWEQNISVIVMLTAVTDMGLVSANYSNTGAR